MIAASAQVDGLVAAAGANDLALHATAEVERPARAGAAEPGLLRRTAHALWSLFAGMVACQSLLLGVIALGWVTRVVRRRVLRQWWKDSPLAARGLGFEAFVAEHDQLAHLSGPTPWLMENRAWSRRRARLAAGRSSAWRGFLARLRFLFHSLWCNFKHGVAAAFNTLAVTLLPGLLLAFGWYGGWNNSFHKGYEQSFVGPLLGFLGLISFAFIMLYAPMAHARQAATGSLRAFWDFRVVRRLVRARWFAVFALAAAYALAGVPIMVLHSAVAALPQILASQGVDASRWSDEQHLEFLNAYYFWAGAYVFTAFVFLRVMAGWIYASALRACLQQRTLAAADLAPAELAALTDLELLRAPETPPCGWLWRALTWTGSKMALIAFTAAAFLVWFAFIFETLVAQFWNYIPLRAWLMHPLVCVPWFHFVPAGLGGEK